MVVFACNRKLIKNCLADCLKIVTFYLAQNRPEKQLARSRRLKTRRINVTDVNFFYAFVTYFFFTNLTCLQKLIAEFLKKWTSENLAAMQQRNKNRIEKQNLKNGDLVYLNDDDNPLYHGHLVSSKMYMPEKIVYVTFARKYTPTENTARL